MSRDGSRKDKTYCAEITIFVSENSGAAQAGSEKEE